MSLPVAEERALTSIEQALRSRDPRLNSLFSIFTRLTRQEAMPAIEQIRHRHWRPQPGAVIFLTLALLVCAVLVGSLTTSHSCTHAPAAATSTSKPSAIAAAGSMVPQCASHPSPAIRTP